MKKHLSSKSSLRNMRRLEEKRQHLAARAPSASKATPLLKQLAAISNHRPDEYLFSIVTLTEPDRVEKASDGTHPQLDALDESFRKELKWTVPAAHVAGPRMGSDVCIAQIRPKPEYNHDGSKQVVAFHREFFDGDDTKRQSKLQHFWEDQINIRPPTSEFIKSALPVWLAARINVPQAATAHMMKMKSIDTPTADALQAALFSTATATLGQVDFDAIAYALCIFVHSHPKFSELVSGSLVPPPYGEQTVYALTDLLV